MNILISKKDYYFCKFIFNIFFLKKLDLKKKIKYLVTNFLYKNDLINSE